MIEGKMKIAGHLEDRDAPLFMVEVGEGPGTMMNVVSLTIGVTVTVTWLCKVEVGCALELDDTKDEVDAEFELVEVEVDVDRMSAANPERKSVRKSKATRRTGFAILEDLGEALVNVGVDGVNEVIVVAVL